MSMLHVTIECPRCHEHVSTEITVVAHLTDDGITSPYLWLSLTDATVNHECRP